MKENFHIFEQKLADVSFKPLTSCFIFSLAIPMLHLIPNITMNPRHVNKATVTLLLKQGHSGLMYLSMVLRGGLSGSGKLSGVLASSAGASPGAGLDMSNSSYRTFL